MFYVTMTDKFMSGWGMAKGLINKLVIECETLEEAKQIERTAHNRNEMKYVNICTTKPSYPTSRYLTSWKKYPQMTGWHK